MPGTPNGDESPRRFSREQYEMLLRCSERGDVREWNEWRKAHPEEEVLLEGADFRKANLKGVDFRKRGETEVHLEGAKFREACLEGTDFWEARLEGADFRETRLEGADFGIAYLEDAVFEGAHLEGVDFGNASLEDADFGSASLEDADFVFACLEGAVFLGAHLEGADFWGAHLEGANFRGARLEGANFYKAHLEGADFRRALVDGETSLIGCSVDRDTDFRMVGLGNARIDAGTRQLLEYNTRRMNWEEWYGEHPCLKHPIRLFWSFSDYGRSTTNILVWVVVFMFSFAAVYRFCGFFFPPGLISNLDSVETTWDALISNFLRALYFSLTIMTSLGFEKMHPLPGSEPGYLLVGLQSILGYVLLGALVTRLSVLFTSGGPAGEFSKRGEREKTGTGGTLRWVISPPPYIP